MKRGLLCVMIAFAATAVLHPSIATGESIAVVNVELVIQQYDAARTAEARLEERAREFSEENERMLQRYRRLEQEFEELRDESLDPALTDEARAQRRRAAEEIMREIAEYEREIRATTAQRRQQLEQQRQRIFASLLNTIRSAITRHAELNNYTLVLDASDVAGSVSAVLYHQAAHDITHDIIERLNLALERPPHDPVQEPEPGDTLLPDVQPQPGNGLQPDLELEEELP